MKEIYISTDIETDGPIPGEYSMLSFASAAFTSQGNMTETFTRNLHTLDGAKQDTSTMEWWKTQPEAWAACRANTCHPTFAMKDYILWLRSLDRKPVFVGYPAGFDFLFVYWYLIKFAGESPFSFSALDIKTYAMAVMKSDYRKATKRHMPKSWFGKKRHTHVALDDAIEQGELFMNILTQNRS